MCPHDIQRVGPLSDGGKWICGMSLYKEKPRAKCVIYSFGVNRETRFEGEMLERTDCEVYAYDASVNAMGEGKFQLDTMECQQGVSICFYIALISDSFCQLVIFLQRPKDPVLTSGLISLARPIMWMKMASNGRL